MGSFSLMHWLIVGIIVILLFGGSRFSNMMGDVAKGIKNFKKGMADEEEKPVEPSRIEAPRAVDPAPGTTTTTGLREGDRSTTDR